MYSSLKQYIITETALNYFLVLKFSKTRNLFPVIISKPLSLRQQTHSLCALFMSFRIEFKQKIYFILTKLSLWHYFCRKKFNKSYFSKNSLSILLSLLQGIIPKNQVFSKNRTQVLVRKMRSVTLTKTWFKKKACYLAFLSQKSCYLYTRKCKFIR